MAFSTAKVLLPRSPAVSAAYLLRRCSTARNVRLLQHQQGKLQHHSRRSNIHKAPATATAASPLLEAVPVWALLGGSAALAAWADRKTTWGRAISAPLLAMILGSILGGFGVLPGAGCPVFDPVWSLVMPIASALLVIETRDIGGLRTDGGKLLAAFAVGAVGMFLGALVSALVLTTPSNVAACLCASYVGGSVNFIATAQALQLPASSLPVTMAADNLAMGVALAALMACPLRLLRRFTAQPTTSSAATSMKGSSADGTSNVVLGEEPSWVSDVGERGSGMLISSVQEALQRQVTIPARMSGQPIARDGTLLLTEEPTAVTLWAAYERSRQRSAYDGDGRGAGAGTVINYSSGSSGAVTPSSTPIVPPELGSGSDSPGQALASLDSGPLARDGSPLLTAEPSPVSLQAAYARSRDTSHDSGDEGASSAPNGGSGGGEGARLTGRSAALSMGAAAGLLWASRMLVDSLGCPHLFLLAVSVLALVASAAGGWGGRGLFSGASDLGALLMGVFFATVGASCSTGGAVLTTLVPLLAFISAMVAVHWVVLLGGARLLKLEPSIVLIASNSLIGGPATAAGMATSRGWGRLVQPAMLCGSLSYGIGSALGLLLGWAVRTLAG